MKKRLVFATSNPNKVAEVKAILGEQYEILSLKDIGCEEDIPETSPSFEGNALQKARYVKEHYQLDCFAEDTGLEVDALNGEPGVFTARYAGEQRDAVANMELVLQKLAGQSNRSARFKTAIALIAHCVCNPARPALIFATACNTNVSAVRPVSMPATK